MKKILVLLFLFPAFIYSQELQAEVIVNFEQLPTVSKEKLIQFENAIEDYLNNSKFTGQSWEYDKIKCNFNIFFVSSAESYYNAQVVISSQRQIYGTEKNSLMMNIMDNQWEFEYENGQSLYFDPNNFNNLTSFLDFYSLIIIGMDMDSYGPNPYQGSDMFSKAYDLAVRGSGSKYSDGWQVKSSSYNKRGLVADLTSTDYRQFRKDFMNYHFNGLDIYKDYPKKARENMARLITNLASDDANINPRSVLLKVFFDAKAGEIISYLQDYEDQDIFVTLKKINPGNISKYDKAMGL